MYCTFTGDIVLVEFGFKQLIRMSSDVLGCSGSAVGCSGSAVGWLKPDFGREHFELIYDLKQKNGQS